MPEPSEQRDARPETDLVLTERARGKAERVVLGSNPYGSMIRIALAVLIFVVIFGTLFFFAQR